jgi:hypothetical protein
MSLSHWRELLGTILVQGKIRESREDEIQAYEEISRHPLPASYRTFCQVFGPGVLAGWYTISVPKYDGSYKFQFDLPTKTERYRKSHHWEDYYHDQEKANRVVIFSDDSAAAIYYWDIDEVTDQKNNEYDIYGIFRDGSLERLSDNFSNFIDICLHKVSKTIYDDQPRLEFTPATGWKRQAKKK